MLSGTGSECRFLMLMGYSCSGCACDTGRGFDVSGQFFLIFRQGPEVAFDLETVPELAGLSKKCSEADGHCWGDRTAGVYDFVDRTWSHTNGTCHGILRYAHGDEVFFQKNFAWGDGWIHDL